MESGEHKKVFFCKCVLIYFTTLLLLYQLSSVIVSSVLGPIYIHGFSFVQDEIFVVSSPFSLHIMQSYHRIVFLFMQKIVLPSFLSCVSRQSCPCVYSGLLWKLERLLRHADEIHTLKIVPANFHFHHLLMYLGCQIKARILSMSKKFCPFF